MPFLRRHSGWLDCILSTWLGKVWPKDLESFALSFQLPVSPAFMLPSLHWACLCALRYNLQLIWKWYYLHLIWTSLNWVSNCCWNFCKVSLIWTSPADLFQPSWPCYEPPTITLTFEFQFCPMLLVWALLISEVFYVQIARKALISTFEVKFLKTWMLVEPSSLNFCHSLGCIHLVESASIALV